MNSDSLIELAVDALAVSRVTRFVTRDTLGEFVRAPVIRLAYGWANGIQGLTDEDLHRSKREWDGVVDSDDDPPKLATFVRCPWCVGMWVAAGVAIARTRPRWWAPAARALALSQVAGLIADL